MESKSQYQIVINTHPINAAVSTATALLTLPVMEEDISITLNQVGLNAAAKITFKWSNDGLSQNILTDSAGDAIEIAWATTSATVGMNLSNVGFAYLHIYLDKLTATAGTITEIITTGLGGVPQAFPVITSPSAKKIAATTVTLYANVDPKAHANVTVEYGTTTSYGTTATAKRVYKNGNVEFDITGLTTATEYHFRFSATNVAGTTLSEDNTFTTA